MTSAFRASYCGLIVPAGGELVVGQWQRVLCGELDGPRTRRVRAQVMGIAGA